MVSLHLFHGILARALHSATGTPRVVKTDHCSPLHIRWRNQESMSSDFSLVQLQISLCFLPGLCFPCCVFSHHDSRYRCFTVHCLSHWWLFLSVTSCLNTVGQLVHYLLNIFIFRYQIWISSSLCSKTYVSCFYGPFLLSFTCRFLSHIFEF